MKEDYEIEEKKQAAADVLYQYSKFAMACIGNRVRPCDLRMHLMKEVSGIYTNLKKESSFPVAASPDAMGESSSSVTLGKKPKFTGRFFRWPLQRHYFPVPRSDSVRVKVSSFQFGKHLLSSVVLVHV
ncbi:hypothetical protein Nepgr_025852 [Nepenthes gracilis]|uniref:Uncharacterized protein n=1 Tax=Nepenthes gracilis TaxID=150966 RepID=A0AAD3T7A5_NEPGR|nr:hypothetical protein Nepgr_025852 [Nepenthes gracilis]